MKSVFTPLRNKFLTGFTPPRNKFLTGFTLVELLMVMAMIGIIASMILVSTQGARKKSKDSRIQSDMNDLRLKAENYYLVNKNYTNICQEPTVMTLKQDINTQGATDEKCFGDTGAYAYSVKLNSDQNVCVDQTNTVKNNQAATGPPIDPAPQCK